jgi:beta-ureidopropionase / N-carbamoyl-L-amino-acid hydrolase
MSGNARINGKRLWQSLMDMATIGATAKGGVCRIGLSEEDRQARDLFKGWCEAAGYKVRVDVFGNMFARRPGRDPDLPAVLVGSHLDSQPTGGKFDGAYGVLAALEILRSFDDIGLDTLRPVEVVNWTNEEGAIFKPMIGSEVFTGALPLASGYAMPDPQGNTLEEDLRRIGYLGDTNLRPDPLYCYFEVHIEQGPILEREAIPIGVVTAGAGIRWYTLTLTGLESHAGPTPMDVRRDALVGAAEVVLAVRQIALEQGEDGRGTVGCLVPYPASPNVIPGRVELTVDFRHASEEALSAMHEALNAAVAEIAERHQLAADLKPTVHSPCVPFHPEVVGLLRDAAKELGYAHRDIISGAGHDAFNMAKVVPTAMLFIPCENGISHNEAENITPEDAEAGGNVLLQAVLRAANDPKPLKMPGQA